MARTGILNVTFTLEVYYKAWFPLYRNGSQMLHCMKNWVVSVTASQKQGMSATRWRVIVFKP